MSDCLFCKIIKKEIPAKLEFEDDQVIAIQDIHPQAPVHLLVIPKKHLGQVSDMNGSDKALLGHLIYTAKNIAADKNWTDYRLLFNNGAEAGQSVFHIHLHLLSGRRMHWPPG